MELEREWVVGFTDGKGCFSVGIYPHPEMTAGYQVLPEFRIVQHQRDVQVLYALKRFFKCGVVRKNNEDRLEFRIRKFNCLMKLVNFFERHPLKTKKQVDFKKFARIIRLMERKEHLNKNGLVRIVKIVMTMNTSDHERQSRILRKLTECG